MKFVDFDQNFEKSKIFQNFHFEKVRFPAPKSRSDCFLHLWNEVSFASGSLEIVLDTYKIHFGWLEADVKLKTEYSKIQPLMYLSTDFRPPRCHLKMNEWVYLSLMKFSLKSLTDKLNWGLRLRLVEVSFFIFLT